jgi:hypothetical protein
MSRWGERKAGGSHGGARYALYRYDFVNYRADSQLKANSFNLKNYLGK